MLIAALALIVVAATAAVVIRDAHPREDKPVTETPETAPRPLVIDVPHAIEPAEPATMFDTDVDAPTQSMPAVAFAGQAAALVYAPIPETAPEPQPAFQPAAFVPAGTPYLQPDPDHLIQTEVVIEDPDREHSAAVTKLVLGLAVSGTAIGLVIVGAGRGIDALIRLLLH